MLSFRCAAAHASCMPFPNSFADESPVCWWPCGLYDISQNLHSL